MNHNVIADSMRYLLANRDRLPGQDWTVQGFGFLRLRLSPRLRLHIWNSHLRVPGVSDIHDHAQWSFTSRILSGQLVNVRFGEAHPLLAPRYNCGIIHAGIGGGKSAMPPTQVDLTPGTPELYEAGDEYQQLASEIHRTYAADGTVTLISQERHDTDTARVFWPIGEEWKDAKPRPATVSEIDFVAAHALSIWKE